MVGLTGEGGGVGEQIGTYLHQDLVLKSGGRCESDMGGMACWVIGRVERFGCVACMCTIALPFERCVAGRPLLGAVGGSAGKARIRVKNRTKVRVRGMGRIRARTRARARAACTVTTR